MDNMQIIATLVGEVNQLNHEYISGNMDRDTWTKSLQNVDDRLSVVGLRLDRRPWETDSRGAKF